MTTPSVTRLRIDRACIPPLRRISSMRVLRHLGLLLSALLLSLAPTATAAATPLPDGSNEVTALADGLCEIFPFLPGC